MVFKERQAIYFVFTAGQPGTFNLYGSQPGDPEVSGCDFMEPGISGDLNQRHLKSRERVCKNQTDDRAGKETGVRECVAESPFCYKENCLLYIPEHLRPMKKGSREEAEQLAGQIRDLVCSTYGHTLVLFTSYTLMGNVHQLLRDQIPFPMVQVWRNSQEEIARFKKMENAVLFAAGSCWEGVDFPGDMVSSLIIVKLPFSVPDPIHEAQKEQYRSLESYIQTIVVPDMQKKLRQGFGRAIRTEQDTCVVSILDHRTAKKGRYRSDVLEALPKCQMAERIEEVENFIRSRKVERYYS